VTLEPRRHSTSWKAPFETMFSGRTQRRLNCVTVGSCTGRNAQWATRWGNHGVGSSSVTWSVTSSRASTAIASRSAAQSCSSGSQRV
jgi:hypothetical protein